MPCSFLGHFILSLVQVMNRLRFGIGRPTSHRDVTSYVLDDFDVAEMPLVTSTINSCVDMLVKQYNLEELLHRQQEDERTKG